MVGTDHLFLWVVHFTLTREGWEYERMFHLRCSANEHGGVSSGASPFATGLSKTVPTVVGKMNLKVLERWTYSPNVISDATSINLYPNGYLPYNWTKLATQGRSVGGFNYGMPKVIAVQVAAVRDLMIRWQLRAPRKQKLHLYSRICSVQPSDPPIAAVHWNRTRWYECFG